MILYCLFDFKKTVSIFQKNDHTDVQSVTGIKFFVLKGSYAKQIESELDKVMDEGSLAYGTIAK